MIAFTSKRIARELNISRERMQHIPKNKLGLKPLKLQKEQEFTDGEKKVDWKEPRSYFHKPVTGFGSLR